METDRVAEGCPRLHLSFTRLIYIILNPSPPLCRRHVPWTLSLCILALAHSNCTIWLFDIKPYGYGTCLRLCLFHWLPILDPRWLIRSSFPFHVLMFLSFLVVQWSGIQLSSVDVLFALLIVCCLFIDKDVRGVYSDDSSLGSQVFYWRLCASLFLISPQRRVWVTTAIVCSLGFLVSGMSLPPKKASPASGFLQTVYISKNIICSSALPTSHRWAKMY